MFGSLRSVVGNLRSFVVGAALAGALVTVGAVSYAQFSAEESSTASFAVVSGVTLDVVPAAIFEAVTWRTGNEAFQDSVIVTNTSVGTPMTIGLQVSTTDGVIAGLGAAIVLGAEPRADGAICEGSNLDSSGPLEGDPLVAADFVLAPGASQTICFLVYLNGGEAPDGSTTETVFTFTGTP